MKSNNPRRVAFDIIERIERERSYADILVDRALAGSELKGPDRGLLNELVFGVLRRRGTLDHIIGCCSSMAVNRLERRVLNLLRIGLYQIFFLDRIPVSAAVNETVNLAKAIAPRASGFINAVLRRADSERESLAWPDHDPAALISARHSLPRWLAGKWILQLGPKETEALADVLNETPQLTVRVNTLKISRVNLLERFRDQGVEAVATDYSPDGIRILSPLHPAALYGFREGLLTVQDESSQLASLFLAPLPGETVLDLCAAPGGKTTHLAQLMENRGLLVACDRDPRKFPRIEETARRLGISIIRTLALDASIPLCDLGDWRFNRILVDAPCSGLGVLRRNPEAKWRLAAHDLERMARLQSSIIRNASDRLVDGGVLLYSTCSVSMEENEEVINDFLSEKRNFVVEDLRTVLPAHPDVFTEQGMFRSWPHRHGMDGFFAARLRKN
ncbi:MAG: 16S rRNA (cytosine(967)-C(5))-methyltransferase RsmB [Geobacteraceae bacterium]|nr:16S rRNA (cytosine(967)-C(5))-methyltransferase RsmB [Geobacteraceae bacterium]